jgi:SpoIID/LytB domain protein
VPSGSTRWRLVPRGSGLALQRLNGASWANVNTVLPASADFARNSGLVRYYRSSATTIDYRGTVGAVRSGSGVIPVNRVGLDNYTRGVIPREMPASWQAEAVKAQAVAARSYARYAFEHNSAQPYDICDTTACQVYGGAAQYLNGVSNSIHEEAASNAAVVATSNRVLTYATRTIFAEFSASNGGITSSGNQPYFLTKADPYDNAASGDPYLSWTETVTASSVADYYGLKQVTEIDITAREGGRLWGGLVKSALVRGLASNGSSTSLTVTGADLASAMGLSYRYFHLRRTVPVGHLDTMSWQGLHVLRVGGWTFDPSHSDVSTTVQVYVDSTLFTATASQPRSDVQRIYKTISAAHGFALNVQVPGGTHKVCVYGVSSSGQDRLSLGCRSKTVGVEPVGHVDKVVRAAAGKVRIAGWAFDPDADGGPGLVHVYIDKAVHGVTANLARPDVQRRYGTANGNVGFDVTLSATAGTHRVCAYAINKAGTAGSNHGISCSTVTI